MKAGTPGRQSQARSRAESGQSPGAERPQERGRGSPQPQPIPHPIPLHQMTPFPTGPSDGLQEPPWRPSGLGEACPASP